MSEVIPPPVRKVESNEEQNPLARQLESLNATSTRSVERLRDIVTAADEHPEYFGEDPELTGQFNARIQEKLQELRGGPELVEKKEEFWKKWKVGSMATAAGGVLVGIGSAVYTAEYGFDASYVKEMFGMPINVPVAAGFLSAAIAEGSAGIAKLMEIINNSKKYALRDNLRKAGIN